MPARSVIFDARRKAAMGKLRAIFPPLLLFLLILGIGGLHVLDRADDERRTALELLDTVCAAESRSLNEVFSRLIGVTEMMASLVRLGTLDKSNFDATALAVVGAFPGVEALGLAPGGIIAVVSPRQGHEHAVGADLFKDPEREHGSQEAIKLRGGVISGPFRFNSGRAAFLCRAPVFIPRDGQEEFWGFVTGVVSLDGLAGIAGLDRLSPRGLAFRLERSPGAGDGGRVLAGNLALGGPEAHRELAVRGVRLMLSIGRDGPVPGVAELIGELLGFAALAAVSAVILALLLRQPVRLNALVERRTARLRQVNLRLAKEIRRRRNATRDLDASVELNRGMFEGTPVVKLLVDPANLTVVDANAAAVRFFGWPREKMIDMGIEEINLNSREEIGQAVALAMRGESRPFLTRHMLASGEVRDVEIYSGPVRRGGTVLLQSVIQDVTERENALRELRKSRERLESIFESACGAIVEADAQGHFLLVNQGFCQMFAMTRSMALGLTFLDVTHPEDRDMSWALHQKLMAGSADRLCAQKRYLRAGGDWFWGGVCISALRDGAGRIIGTVALITDVTQLLEARQAAEAASRAKSRFLANVGHEIRTPLNAIMGLTELTLRTPLDPRQRDHLEKSLQAGRTLLQVIESIVDYSRIESGRMELARVSFSPAEMFYGLGSRMAAEAAAKGLAFRCEAGDGVPRDVLGDPVRLEQVLANLAENAVKFTSRGEVALRMEAETASPGNVRLRFSVSDTGPGLSQEKLKHLFEPFAQGEAGESREWGGTGLGLSIAGRLAALMGGSITVESVEGRGSVFRFNVEVPLARGEAVDGLPDGLGKEFEELVEGLAGARVLVVDDNLLGRHTAMEVLKQGGIIAAGAQDGPSALELLARERYDVVLLDIQMPGMDGYETLKRIRALPGGETLPVVALTGQVSDDDRVRCFEAGMDDCLTKPIDSGSLFAALRQLIRKREPEQAPAERPLNSERALALLMGNSRLYGRLLGGFVREYSDAGERMRSLVSTDRSEALTLAHSIKGLAANLGGERLARASLELEAALRDADEPSAQAGAQVFAEALEEFSTLASQYVGKSGENS